MLAIDSRLPQSNTEQETQPHVKWELQRKGRKYSYRDEYEKKALAEGMEAWHKKIKGGEGDYF